MNAADQWRYVCPECGAYRGTGCNTFWRRIRKRPHFKCGRCGAVFNQPRDLKVIG